MDVRLIVDVKALPRPSREHLYDFYDSIEDVNKANKCVGLLLNVSADSFCNTQIIDMVCACFPFGAAPLDTKTLVLELLDLCEQLRHVPAERRDACATEIQNSARFLPLAEFAPNRTDLTWAWTSVLVWLVLLTSAWTVPAGWQCVLWLCAPLFFAVHSIAGRKFLHMQGHTGAYCHLAWELSVAMVFCALILAFVAIHIRLRRSI
jgi:hypothetical protein